MIHDQTSSTDTHGSVWVQYLDGASTIITVYPVCPDVHRWRCDSLRGSNRTQRVETVECRDCGRMERRVWLGRMNAPRPDRVHVLRESHGQTVTA